MLAEVFVAWALPQPDYAIRLSPWGWEHLNSISYHHAPGSKESIVDVRYNSQGFRNSREFSKKKPEDTLRIAILGDSEAEGSHVGSEYSAGKVLEGLVTQHLSTQYPGSFNRVEVINAGVYGYDPCQYLQLFLNRVQGLQPDIVMIVHFNALASDNYCTYGADKVSAKEMIYSRLEYLIHWSTNYATAKSHLLRYVHRALRKLVGATVASPNKLNKFMVTYSPPELSEQRLADYSPDPIDSFVIPFDPNGMGTSLSQEHEQTWLIFREFGKIAEESRMKLWVLFGNTADGLQPFMKKLQSEGMNLFDLGQYLVAHKESPVQFRAGHLNEYGNLLMGRALFDLAMLEID